MNFMLCATMYLSCKKSYLIQTENIACILYQKLVNNNVGTYELSIKKKKSISYTEYKA